MLGDILTVMWKEGKELFTERETVRGTLASLLGPLIMVAALGIVAPWQVGPTWVETPMSSAVALFVALMFGGTTAGSIAGERERHTLETLLASRLSDRGILLGKIGIAVCFASTCALGTVLLGMVIVNLTGWTGRLLVYPLIVLVADVMLGLLTATLAATVGVFVSLRSATVREAEQNVMAILGVGSMVLVWGSVLALRTIPGLEARFSGLVADLSFVEVFLVLVSVLAVLDTGFLAAADRRFQRARLTVV
ncbi:MAG: ABC transporter permease subunit [Anaerolineae bacterium]|jgi:ABC-2 type transport system permease protein